MKKKKEKLTKEEIELGIKFFKILNSKKLTPEFFEGLLMEGLEDKKSKKKKGRYAK